MSPKGECSKMSAAVNSMIGAQSDSIGRGTEGSESGEESGTLESRASQGTGLVFGSIAVEIAAPKVVSSHPSSIGAVGSELRVGADSCAASRGPAAELNHAHRDSAARLAVARICRRSSLRGCRSYSSIFQI